MASTIRLMRWLEYLLAGLLLACVLSSDGLSLSDEPDQAARRFTRAVEFDYVDWTLQALQVKLVQASLDSPAHFDPPARRAVVDEYLQLIGRIESDEYGLALIFADPSIADPQAASADLRRTLAESYARLDRLGPLAEAVLQEQLSALLADLGLTFLGQPLPPVLFHVSDLPYNLVISPRREIRQEASLSLIPELPVDRHAALEEAVDAGLGVSSLVVPVGGLGTYPTMVMRSTSLGWMADTVAHEWIHNWLALRPLGLNYETTPELRTMNETAASIAGGEISRLLLERFYTDQLAVSSPAAIRLSAGPIGPGDFQAPVFDFRAEMHATRLEVDALLAEGRVEEAEAYMESRRLVFWEYGYPIRKLNQAYFAFYGAYADVPGGPAGEDPVGPAVRLLRERSASLTDFLVTIARMSSFEQLQAWLSP